MLDEKDSSTRVPWGAGRIAFRAHIPDIQKLIDAGWPITTIYQQLQGSLAGLSYRQFITHIRKHFPSTSPTQNQKPSPPSTEKTLSLESPLAPRLANNETSRNLTRTPKFQPGPRIPDPKEIY